MKKTWALLPTTREQRISPLAVYQAKRCKALKIHRICRVNSFEAIFDERGSLHDFTQAVGASWCIPLVLQVLDKIGQVQCYQIVVSSNCLLLVLFGCLVVSLSIYFCQMLRRRAWQTDFFSFDYMLLVITVCIHSLKLT